MPRIYIINPTGTTSKKKSTSSSTKQRSAILRKRKKAKRSHASYVKAGKKAARTRARKRRKNPTRHRPVVYSYGRGKSKKLRRSPHYRLSPKRVNPKRKRRGRKSPMRLRKMGSQFFGRARMQNAIMLLVGLGISAGIKGVITRMMPEGQARDWTNRLFGVGSIVAGVVLQMQSRRKAFKSAGMGMVAFGLYDVIVVNTGLGKFLPSIGTPGIFLPAETTDGYRNFGRSAYSGMGASLSPGAVHTVGANVGPGMPEIIGQEMDLADALEMAA